MKQIFILWLLYAACESKTHSKKNPDIFNIGGVLSTNNSVFHFHRSIQVMGFIKLLSSALLITTIELFSWDTTYYVQNINFDTQFVPWHNTYYAYSILMDPNPIRTALSVCNQLVSKRVSIKSREILTMIYILIKIN